MASSDGPSHPLTLKVMRISRPTLASAWEPFYSSSPSFSAHSSASILSLQGDAPLPGNPKTLRDLSHATELLTLPSTFGAIQLGETFSSCLCLSNEAAVDTEAVSLKVEMQTTTSKVILAEIGGSNFRLRSGVTVDNVVNFEIKELGQHVLACAVSYRSPSKALVDVADPNDPSMFQSFRKFYKFSVTNPFTVKTKVHSARSPTALLSILEREKIFLEVHIQNTTSEAIWFERMAFQPIEGWTVLDANTGASRETKARTIYEGSNALMQPNDIRHYIYIMLPSSLPPTPVVYTPGSTLPLGRLDIAWRSTFGEPGRLLTSTLSRRIPVPQPPAPQPASALPSYLKRAATVSSPSRPQSPQAQSNAPPPYRPASPFRNRGSTTPRSQSPIPSSSSRAPQATSSDVTVDLAVIRIPQDAIRVHQPFTVLCRSVVSCLLSTRQKRTLHLVIEHAQASRPVNVPPPVPKPPIPDAVSPRMSVSSFSTPSPTSSQIFNYPLAHQKASSMSLAKQVEILSKERTSSPDNMTLPSGGGVDRWKTSKIPDVTFLGPSAISLTPIHMSGPTGSEGDEKPRMYSEQEFELSYMPMMTGFLKVDGFRVLLVEDKVEDPEDEDKTNESKTLPSTLREWDVIAEIWVKD